MKEIERDEEISFKHRPTVSEPLCTKYGDAGSANYL